MCDSVSSYSRDQLLGLKPVWCQLSAITLDTIRLLGLRRRRGVRAGRNKQRPISVVSSRSLRSRDRLCPNTTVNVNNSVKSDCARNVVPVRRIRQTQPTVYVRSSLAASMYVHYRHRNLMIYC